MPVKRCEYQSPTEGEADEVRSLDPQCPEEPRGSAQRKAGWMVAAGPPGRVEPREMSPCWRVVFPDVEHAAAASYLRELAASDCSPATIRTYAYALLRWFRFLHERFVGLPGEYTMNPTRGAVVLCPNRFVVWSRRSKTVDVPLTREWISRLDVKADRPNRLVVTAQLGGNPAVHLGTLSVRLRTPEVGRVVALLANVR